MSENVIPEENVISADVEQNAAPVAEQPAPEQPEVEQSTEVKAEEPAAEINLADKTLADLSDIFRSLMDSADRMSRSKEAEAIKSAFYKLLVKLRSEAESASEAVADKLTIVEDNFKSIYAEYKQQRAEYNREQDELKAANLAAKQQIIEDLKKVVDNQDAPNPSFQALRDIQDRWRAVGPVPQSAFRNLNDSYQFYVEKFYDMVKINRDLRDLDFKKNLEAKTAFCEAAEKLSENENIVSAFNELQKLHEQWKEFGPVASEFREQIWDRFKAATAVINKRYQAHFEEIKSQQADNLAAKTVLCEKVEEIAAREVKSSGDWAAFSKEIEDLQAEWRKIGFATKKENQKIYDRFRAACDAFFERKRTHYTEFKGKMDENYDKKMALVEQVEALKSSTEWKKTTDLIIKLQKEWKEIGAVPRKKSEQLWKRFRSACDEFFAERDKQSKPENNFYANLKAKNALIGEVKNYEPSSSESENAEAMRQFNARWQEIGFVPFKEKESVNAAFREAMQQKFPLFSQKSSSSRQSSKPRSAKDILVKKYNDLQQDIETYENNIGFFSASKNAAPLIAQMQERIAQAKAELKALEEQIRSVVEGEE